MKSGLLPRASVAAIAACKAARVSPASGRLADQSSSFAGDGLPITVGCSPVRLLSASAVRAAPGIAPDVLSAMRPWETTSS
ncbi:hypothetical protein D3C71_1895600 [compost metagenome]